MDWGSGDLWGLRVGRGGGCLGVMLWLVIFGLLCLVLVVLVGVILFPLVTPVVWGAGDGKADAKYAIVARAVECAAWNMWDVVDADDRGESTPRTTTARLGAAILQLSGIILKTSPQRITADYADRAAYDLIAVRMQSPRGERPAGCPPVPPPLPVATTAAD